jgi:hypothetical protein
MVNRIVVPMPNGKLDWDNWGKPITDAVNQHDTFITGFGITTVMALTHPSDETIISNAAPRDDLILSWPVIAGGIYRFDIAGWYTSASAAGLAIQIASPGVGDVYGGTLIYENTLSGSSQIAIPQATDGRVNGMTGLGTSTPQAFRYTGTLFCDATLSGNARFQWWQNTSTASNTTMRQGTSGVLYRCDTT